MPKLLAVFDRPDRIAEAATRLRGRGYVDLETYSPAPFPEVDDAVIEKPSRVRAFTLVGGLTGAVTGYAMTLWMANDWQIMLGGKPFSSIPPYTIIAYELNILFGGVLGVVAGVSFALLVRAMTPLPASIQPWSVLISLGVASSVGLFFGVYPATRAAQLDPIAALRQE